MGDRFGNDDPNPDEPDWGCCCLSVVVILFVVLLFLAEAARDAFSR